MNTNWEIIAAIYDEAIDLEESSWHEFVSKKCKEDSKIFTQVMKMLEASHSQDFMGEYPGKINPDNIEFSKPEQLGHFKILKKIATGGMGRVYLAQSSKADVPIKVALKTIRIELINDELKRKFQNEKKILSQLRHKNIASLIDAGITDDNIPYIATEWVDGVTINHHCQDNNLSLKKRLNLFIQVCQAVAFAHNKLIIHRDIKPDNILVNQQGQVKLLDFGIAKIVDENQNIQTATQIFTPDYAAPEQLSGEMCTAATDIYSLGIILFELLTNSRRFNLSNLPITEKLKTITVPKQANLSNLQSNKPLPYSLSKVKGVLITIINKAMHVEPLRRYNSVISLILDVENYIEKRPIMAMRDSYWYKFKMLILRNKLSSALLLFALFTVSVSAFVTFKQLNEKILEVQKSQQVTDFLINSIQASDPDLTQGKQTSLVEFLQNAKIQIQQKTFSDAKLSSLLKQTIGIALSKVGQYKDAESTLIESIQGNPKNYKARIGLVQLFLEQKSFHLVEEHITYLLENKKELSITENSQTQILEAELLFSQGQFNRAVQLLKTLIKSVATSTYPLLAIDAKLTLASILDETGHVDESIKILKSALEFSKKHFGNTSTQTTNIMNELARVLSNTSPVPWTEVFSLYQESLKLQIKLYGKYHPVIAKTLLNQGFAYKFHGKIDKAFLNANKAREISIRNFGESHILTAHCDLLLSQINYQKGELAQAINLLEKSITVYSKYYGDNHFLTNELKTTLAVYFLKSKKGEKALNLLLPLYESQINQLGQFNKATFYVKLNIIKAYILLNQNNKAIYNAEKALQKAQEIIGKQNIVTVGIQMALVQSYIHAKKYNKALPLSKELLSFDLIKNTPVYHEAGLKLFNEAQQNINDSIK